MFCLPASVENISLQLTSLDTVFLPESFSSKTFVTICAEFHRCKFWNEIVLFECFQNYLFIFFVVVWLQNILSQQKRSVFPRGVISHLLTKNKVQEKYKVSLSENWSSVHSLVGVQKQLFQKKILSPMSWIFTTFHLYHAFSAVQKTYALIATLVQPLARKMCNFLHTSDHHYKRKDTYSIISFWHTRP